MEIKQDINFLDKPLWFQNKRSDKNGIVWTDIDGYIYRTAYKVPEKLDMLVLFFILLESQRAEYKQKLFLTRYEIIKGCGFTIDSKIYSRVEDALRRWTNVTIEFQGTFYDDKEYISMAFHIIDSYEIKKSNGKIEVHFNPLWLLKIKESNFFKYLNFDYYKALKRPVSRRLFEILCKTFKGRNHWQIDLVKLGKKLTLSGKKILKEGKEIEVLYSSAVLVAIKPAINEINRLAEDKKALEALNVKAEEAFKIEFKLSEDKKVITFEKVVPNWVKAEAQIKSPKAEAQIKAPTEVKEALPLKQLYEMSKSQTISVKEAIKICCSEKGFEYVRGNILYANEKATKNYGAYLKKCLKEDWGAEFREVERKKEETEKTLKEEKIKEKEKLNKTCQKLEELERVYEALAHEEIARLEPLALEKCVALGMRRNFISRITLMEKIVELHQEENQSKPNTIK